VRADPTLNARRAVGLAGVLAAVAALLQHHLGDYALHLRIGDNPAPVIQALLHGDLHTAVALQPVMGGFSMLVRAPFVALANALGGSQLAAYRLGVLPCALALVLLGAAVALRSRRGLLAGAALMALLVLNPVSASALWGGHPEELLGGALCAGAVLAAAGERNTLAALLLGCAIATKEWTLLAVGPTLVAARPRARVRLVLVAGAVAAPLVLALPLADPHAFLAAARDVGRLRLLSDTDWWWPFASSHTVLVHVGRAASVHTLYHLPLGLSRSGVSWLIPLLSLPLTLLYARRPRTGDRAEGALALLALLLLLRCALDPISMLYYHAPFVAALGAWEATRRRELPLATLAASVLLWAAIDHGAATHALRAASYAAITLPLAGILAAAAFGALRRRAPAALAV
jgi:hypothetical protein